MASVVPPCEDYFLSGCGPEEAAHTFAGVFHEGGSLLREGVDSAMNVGFMLIVNAVNGVDHFPRGLCGRCIVKIDKRAPIYLTGENREFAAVFFDGKRHCGVELF